jgi:hypothetical protein
MSQRSSSNPFDVLVSECFFRATEVILQERRAHLRPITSQSYTDHLDYVRNVLNNWRSNLITPLTLDLYMHIPKTNEHILIERWQFSYQLQSDLKDAHSSFALVNRRVQTLLRSLYCFVRILPGFNILHQCSIRPLINFQLYSEQRAIPSIFKQEVSKYNFAKISTSKGFLSISITFLNSNPVKVCTWQYEYSFDVLY